MSNEVIGSVLFKRPKWTTDSARTFLDKLKIQRNFKVHITPRYLRYRVRAGTYSSFRTAYLKNDVVIVYVKI